MAFSALLLFLLISPLMRGGNRQVALIVIEAAALIFLVAWAGRARLPQSGLTARGLLLVLVCLSPAWLAAAYLLPLPVAAWSSLPGRADYLALMEAAGMPPPESLALSLVPAATKASLLAGIPLVAAFIAGLTCSLRQLKVVFVCIAAAAMMQILLGMLQMAGGPHSPLFMGAPAVRPLGTFANPNHLANYVSMALIAFVWLAWARTVPQLASVPKHRHDPHAARRSMILWSSGAVLLVVGVLMSRSRGAMLSGMVTAIVAVLLVRTVGAGTFGWRKTLLSLVAAVVVAVALVGVEAVVSRLDVSQMAADAPSRAIQASTTLEGAAGFWPVGAGWGTYAFVYPRYQPSSLVGTADYAHHDYAQMLFEGGVFALVLMACVGFLVIGRGISLVRAGLRRRRLRTDEMAAAICGLGLLGFLLHSFVEFNMHIPANAILASLLAGVYLRSLNTAEPTQDA